MMVLKYHAQKLMHVAIDFFDEIVIGNCMPYKNPICS